MQDQDTIIPITAAFIMSIVMLTMGTYMLGGVSYDCDLLAGPLTNSTMDACIESVDTAAVTYQILLLVLMLLALAGLIAAIHRVVKK